MLTSAVAWSNGAFRDPKSNARLMKDGTLEMPNRERKDGHTFFPFTTNGRERGTMKKKSPCILSGVRMTSFC